MNRATAYGLLCAELESRRNVPYEQLVSQIGERPFERIVADGNEVITVEVRVHWSSDKRTALRVEATAYGSSSFAVERLEESIIVRPR